MTEHIQKTIPEDWDSDIHQLWLAGKITDAMKVIVEKVNSFKEKKPQGLLKQLGYYLFLLKDYKSAHVIFKIAYETYPDDEEALLNLAVSLSLSSEYKDAIFYLTKLLKDDPKNFIAWDSLASNYSKIEEYTKASKAGKNSLIIKDKKFGTLHEAWNLPDENIQSIIKDKKKVIAFSLWGNEKRYIFGALRNLLLAPDIYPDWELWFYLDNSVSPGFVEIIEQLGGNVIVENSDQPAKEKLCWRFKVANHPEVGYFLIRDVDSVFSIREYIAVQQWIDSGKWFHVIRDWWTHTDLMLAGLWGGVANVLPDLQLLLNNYSPGTVNTPNIDQWFLRDCVWKYVKKSCLVHDRCFEHENSIQISAPLPSGDNHIGACEYHQRPEFQEKILSAWIEKGRPA